MLALDTNTLIYYFKVTGRVADDLKAAAPRDIAIPAVVLYELMVEVNRSTQLNVRRKHLRTLPQTIRALPFDESCARRRPISAFIWSRPARHRAFGYAHRRNGTSALRDAGHPQHQWVLPRPRFDPRRLVLTPLPLNPGSSRSPALD